MTLRIEKFEGADLYLGDCQEIASSLNADALISDPPYGQNHQNNVALGGRVRHYRSNLPGQGDRALNSRPKVGTYHGSQRVKIWPNRTIGDTDPFDPLPWIDSGRYQKIVFWGAHRFADRLPAGSWLIWDKVPTGKVRDQGDGEACWISDRQPRPLRIYRLLWDGVCVGAAARSEVTAGQQREHPMQKPVAVMQWCIDQARLKADSIIIDPYMGSGSTGVAALRQGFKFIGIEIEPLYFEAACRRIDVEARQMRMAI